MATLTPLSKGDDRVRKRASNFVEFINKVVVWARDGHLPEDKKSDLLLQLSSLGRAARNIEKVAKSPLTVALFGQSGAGKSYLVNEVVRESDANLEVLIGGYGNADFLTEINPGAGAARDCTALVTRFSRCAERPTYEAFPIHIRLLSCTDMIKILVNGYAYECIMAEGTDPSHFNADTSAACGRQRCGALLTPDEIYDIQSYVATNIHNPYYSQLSKTGYWDYLRNVMICADRKSQIEAVSVLWGRVNSLTELCSTLLGYLRELDSEEIWVEQAALMPCHNQSIIDANTLFRHLRSGADDKVKFVTSKSMVGEIRKSSLCALTAELVLLVPRQSSTDLLSIADFLDFPGARARGNSFSETQLDSPPKDRNAIDPLAEVFFRGKIAYLFERYVELRDINSLLLCLDSKGVNAHSMRWLIRRWIDDTHGRSHIERDSKSVGLYVVFTKFDETLRADDGIPANRQDRWESRLRNGFSDFFRMAYDGSGPQEDAWPDKWDRQGPFRNCYWVRNPHVPSGVFETDPSTGREKYASGHEAWIGELKPYYLENQFVKMYLPDAELKWNAVTKPGCNGIGLLVKDLLEKVKPQQKRDQLHLQMDALHETIRKILRPYAVDVGKVEAAERLAAQHAAELRNSLQRTGSFGIILERLGITEKMASDLYEKAANEDHAHVEDNSDSGEIPWGTVAGVQDAHGLDATDEASAREITDSDDQNLSMLYGNKAARLAELVFNVWHAGLSDLRNDQHFLGLSGLSHEWCQTFVDQLVFAAERRFTVRRHVAKCSADALSSPDPLSKRREQAFLLSYLMNNLVTNLGDSPMAIPAMNTGNPKATGKAFPGQMLFEAWVARLRSLYMENAGVTDQVERSVKASKELEHLLNNYNPLLE